MDTPCSTYIGWGWVTHIQLFSACSLMWFLFLSLLWKAASSMRMRTRLFCVSESGRHVRDVAKFHLIKWWSKRAVFHLLDGQVQIQPSYSPTLTGCFHCYAVSICVCFVLWFVSLKCHHLCQTYCPPVIFDHQNFIIQVSLARSYLDSALSHQHQILTLLFSKYTSNLIPCLSKSA